jgi:protein translocase SecG subunit
MILSLIGVVILLSSVCIIVLTLMLNTKSDGLGAAVTGASDSYRGAIGVEDQKRRLIYYTSWVFGISSLIFTILETYGVR